MKPPKTMNAEFSRREFLVTTAAATVAVVGSPGALAESQTKLTVALVGGAHIHTPSFVELVKSRNDIRVKSVWDHDKDRAQKRAHELNSQVVSDVRTIWSDPEI